MSKPPKLEKCPFCNGDPTVEDHRLVWTVRCECGCCILGLRAPEPQSEEEANATDWDHYRQTAIDAWNTRAVSRGELHWRSNHDSVVAKSRILIDRRDMPVERVKAFKYITHLQNTIHNLETELNSLREST